tara:strand:- start:29 stop:526 length:498 start_codon:yes stop_codon:yes gene_type:complete
MAHNGESHKQINFPVINVTEIPSPSFFRLAGDLDRNHLMYLASPYASNGKVTQRVAYDRAAATTDLTMKLLESGIWVFSPIVYGMSFLDRGHKKPAAWWMRRDIELFKHCTVLGVHCLPGWEDSPGVQKEIEWALLYNKKIYLLEDASLAMATNLGGNKDLPSND